MQSYVKVSLILCSFGFFREFRPNEPFATEFLSNGEYKNITAEQVNRLLYPIGTYSYLGQLIIIFLITDLLRYRPIIIISACVGVALFAVMAWTTTLAWMFVVQLCYGFFMAAEVAYYTYMYARVERDKYQKVTSHTRAAILAGKFLAGALGQVLVSFDLMDLRELNFISVGSQAVSVLLAFLLPGVKQSVYFHKSEVTDTENGSKASNSAMELIWKHFKDAYTDRSILYWSIWWSLATCGFLQILSYVQVLWHDIDSSTLYNGAVEAINTLCGALSALLAGLVQTNVRKRLNLILVVFSIVQGGAIVWSALTSNILIAYATYIFFSFTYMFMITLVSASVAEKLSDDSFALIFGINTFLALLLQTILTIVVVGESGFALSPRNQFVVFGGYFVAFGVLCCFLAVFNHFVTRKRID